MWKNLLLLIPFLAMLLLPGHPSSVVLSFDTELSDSPEQVYRVLEILKERGIPATFFVLGEFAEKYPEAIAGIQGDGHELGYHSFNHPVLTRLQGEELSRQVSVPSYLSGVQGFRAPWQRTNREVMEGVAEAGYGYDASRWDAFALTPSPYIPELLASTWFGLPVSDMFFIHSLHMPSVWRFLIKHIKAEQLVLVMHPHIVLENEKGFTNLIDSFHNASFVRCRDAV